ncbi:MAG: hypothetical protein J5613_03580 [Alphaproteobacteria bacterium]|nr:hypothetical protein [Alphaproteobacteria bacterium]
MTEPNGMTYMTDSEREVLGRLKDSPVAVAQMSHPSEEFLLYAVCINPYIIRFVHNQSFLLRMLAVKLDYRTLKYVNGTTPEILKAAAKHNEKGLDGANLTKDEKKLYDRAVSIMKSVLKQPRQKGGN